MSSNYQLKERLMPKNGLPERSLIQAVAALGGAADLKKAAEQAGIEPQFIQIALGWAIRKKWATYNSKDNMLAVREQAAVRLRRNPSQIPKRPASTSRCLGRAKPRTQRSS